jgi:diacylglycerol kinase (ATP)
MKRCVIVNPIAGSIKGCESALFAELGRLDPAEMKLTHGVGEAESHARAAVANGCDEIICAGGDGTLNEVVNGIADARERVRVGLIPLGTGNDFARSLEAPAKISENIDIIAAGATRALDLIRARSENVRYFINVSAGGFSGLVDEKLTPELKKTWGPLAYIRGAAAALSELRGYRTSVQIDDEHLDVDLYNVVIANARYVAGGLPVAPEADVCDGKMDVVLVRVRPAAEMVLLAAQILRGKHLDQDAVIFERASRVRVESAPGMWFNVDGELIGNEPITFEVLPRALQFLVKSA